jgi:hypothetical protein
LRARGANPRAPGETKEDNQPDSELALAAQGGDQGSRTAGTALPAAQNRVSTLE